ERIDRDAGSGEVLRPDHGRRFERRLRRTVRRESVHHHGEKARHDVDDSPPTLIDQPWSDRLGHHERAIEIDVDGSTPGVRVDFKKVLSLSNEDVADVLHAKPGIVDEAVYRAEVISGF